MTCMAHRDNEYDGSLFITGTSFILYFTLGTTTAQDLLGYYSPTPIQFLLLYDYSNSN